MSEQDEPINGNDPVPNIKIQTYDPMVLLQAQAMFGQHVLANPELTRLVNAYGPVLFATLLFTTCEDYRTDEADPTMLVPGRSVTEAEAAAIGVLRGVASAMGLIDGDITIEPTNAEVEEDTDINPV